MSRLRPLPIGPLTAANNVVLAPMAGVTDLPFRRLCRAWGAGLAVAEMVAANPATWQTGKSRTRAVLDGEPAPRSVQLLGNDPAQMAAAARRHVALGAQIIDINLGCPAKKVCRKAAGSALLGDPALVRDILQAVVEAVAVPVTLKMRTGLDPARRNAVAIARLAEDCGIALLAVHGRTRADQYRGRAEYDTLRAVCASVGLPVLANGDIDTPQRAAQVLDHTGAAGVMIGRAAHGQPWLFRRVTRYLAEGRDPGDPPLAERLAVLRAHVAALHDFYGPERGVRVARKHIGWYLAGLPGGPAARGAILRAPDARAQLARLDAWAATCLPPAPPPAVAAPAVTAARP